MKQINKKAAECTAIHPTAEKYNLCESAKIIGISTDDFTEFYLLRQYIRKEPYGYSATELGIEKGCFVNDKNCNAFATEKAVCRVAKVFAA